MNYKIALFISIVANALFLFSILSKNKKDLFKWQFLETILNIVKNTLLGGFSGATTQLIGVVRNFVLMKGYNIPYFPYILSVIQVILGISVNKHGYIGLLPVVASVSYTLVSFYTHSERTVKKALVFNLFLWGIYEILLKDYITLAVGILFITITIYNLYKTRGNVKNETNPWRFSIIKFNH